MKKRIISMLLTVLMLAGLFPVSAFAVEAEVPAEQQATAEAHVHEYVFVEEVPAEVGRDGVKAHYACTDCDKLFILEEDEYVEVQPEELVIPALPAEEKTAEPAGERALDSVEKQETPAPTEAPVEPESNSTEAQTEPTSGDNSALNAEVTEGQSYSLTPEEPAMDSATVTNELLTEDTGTVQYSGTCGDNLTWTLTDTGLLTISGTGNMTNYNSSSPAPWFDYRNSILNVSIGDEVTGIGSCAFAYCTGLTKMYIPSTVTTISASDYYYSPFYCCSSNLKIYCGVTSKPSGWDYDWNYMVSCYYGCTREAYDYFSKPLSGDIVIPAYVSTIPEYALYNNTDITNIIIENGVTSIGEKAFANCIGLKKIYIPSSVTTISASDDHHSPFFGCSFDLKIYCGASSKPSNWSSHCNFYSSGSSLSCSYGCTRDTYDFCTSASGDIVIPDSMTNIPDYAFYNNKDITSVTIEDGVTSIGSNALANCTGLKNIYIPSSVTTICESYYDDGPFNGCSSDLRIYCGASSKQRGWGFCWNYYSSGSSLSCYYGYTSGAYDYFSNPLSGDIVIPASVGTIPSNVFYENEDITSVIIENGITSIGDNAFYGCTNLYSVVIPDSVESIGDSAFRFCTGLETVGFGDNSLLKSIGTYAFSACDNLLSFDFPYGVESIGDSAFSVGYYYYDGNISYDSSSGGLMNLNLPDTVTSLGKSAFKGCKLRSINISSALTEIPDYCFSRSNYYSYGSSVSIDLKNVTKLGQHSLQGYTPVSLSKVTELADYALACCELDNVDLSNAVSIGAYALGGADISKSIKLPDGLTSIPEGLFSNCRIYCSLELPAGLQSIGKYAFQGCVLSGLKLPSTLTSIGTEAFSCSENYGYDYGLSRVDIPSGVTTIEQKTFYNRSDLEVAVIPASVKTIKAGAFTGCNNLTIYCAKGSAAETYAINNGIAYMSIEKAPAVMTDFTLSVYSITAKLYRNYEFSLTPIPANAFVGDVVVSYDYNSGIYAGWYDDAGYGYIICQSNGSGTITVSAGGISKTIQVYCPATLTGLSMIQSMTLETKSTGLLTVSPYPVEAVLDGVTWKSSNPSVVSVAAADESGTTAILTAGSVVGQAVITASSGGKKITCTVTVEAPRVSFIDISDENGVLVNESEVNYRFVSGEKHSFTAVSTPSNATAALAWFTSNPSVAAVSNGVVTLKGLGSAVITAKSKDSAGALQYFTINCDDVKPVLSTKAITINSWLTAGTVLSVYPASDTSIYDFSIVKKLKTGYEEIEQIIVSNNGDNQYELSYDGVGKVSYSAYAAISLHSDITSGDYTEYLPLKVSVINTAPKVTVTLEKINTYYPDNSFAVTATVTNGTLSWYQLAENSSEFFELYDDGKLVLTDYAKAVFESNPKAKVTSPVIFNVYCEGSDNPVTVSVKPSVSYTVPSVSAKGMKLNKFYTSDVSYAVPITIKNGVLSDIELAGDSSEYFGLDSNNRIYMKDSAYQTGVSLTAPIKLNVYLEGVDQAFAVSIKPTVSYSAPSLYIADQSGKKLSSVVFNPFFGGDTCTFAVYDKSLGTPVSLSGCSVTLNDNAYAASVYDSDKGLVELQYLLAGTSVAKTKLLVESDCWNGTAAINVAAKFEKQPTVSISSKGKLDLISRLNGLTLTPKISGVTDVTVINMSLVSVSDANGNDASSAFKLAYNSDLGTALLTMDQDAAIQKVKHTAVVSVCVYGRGCQQEFEKAITFTPTQSKLGVKTGTIGIYAGDSSAVSLALTPSDALLDQLDVVSKPEGFTVISYPETKSITVSVRNTVNKGSYTIVLNALPKGAVPGTAATKIILKVSVLPALE